jgi:hypothetical protein
MRYCTANGILLCNQTFQPRAFDCIWSFCYDGSNWSQQWIYEESLEHIKVVGYRGGTVALAYEIAHLLCITEESIKEMTRKCESDAVYFATCHNRAKVWDITDKEKKYWDGQPIRRCHSCVNASPSRSATCLWCAAEWLCKVDSSPSTTFDVDDEDSDDPAKPEVTKATPASAVTPEEPAPPAVVSTAGDFPSAEGVKWDLVESTGWGTLVKPTKRRGSGVPGESVADLPSFLDFSEKRACGTHSLVNRIYTMSISVKHIDQMEARWKGGGTLSIDPFVSFLEKRTTENQDKVSSLFSEPEEYANGWYSFKWKAYDQDNLPKKTMSIGWEKSDAIWTQGWHGTKFETIYKTCVDGGLSDSTNDPGRRILDGRPGVYMMPSERKEKALFYARPVCLNDDGVVYRALWEVVTDRHDRKSSGNDQWIAPQRSVKLVALWVRIEKYKDMTKGDELQLSWDDAIEIPPDFYAKRKADMGICRRTCQ